MDNSLRKKVNLTNPYHFLGFGFGSGLIPLMPGTMGSLAAVPLILAMGFVNVSIYIVITIFATVLGVLICKKVSEDLGVHDHGSIVWDEIAGMMVVFIAIPITWYNLLIGFVLFRIFDIWKPWPISFLDKHIHGGFGIMIDDIVAGIFALLVMHAWLVLQMNYVI